jgi:hypothetical protein
MALTLKGNLLLVWFRKCLSSTVFWASQMWDMGINFLISFKSRCLKVLLSWDFNWIYYTLPKNNTLVKIQLNNLKVIFKLNNNYLLCCQEKKWQFEVWCHKQIYRKLINDAFLTWTLFFIIIHLFTCAYIVWVIFPRCPFLHPLPPSPLSSRQVLFCLYH